MYINKIYVHNKTELNLIKCTKIKNIINYLT